MRGEAERQIGMLTLVTPEQRVRGDHPLRRIKPLADAVLKDLSPTFEKMYSSTGRPSIPPERLLKASLLMGFYTVRSERLFCEQLDYNLLFRWFLDMGLDEPSFDHSSFSRNRARLLKHDVAREFFARIVEYAQDLGLMSDDHFRWTERLDRELGPRSRVSSPKMAATITRLMTLAIPPSTSMGSDAPNATISRPPTPKPAWRAGCGQGSQAVLLGQCADGEPQWAAGRLSDRRSQRDGRATHRDRNA